MKTDANHYVYAYFDPRNYEMFYVGQGKGSRKNAHRPDKAGTEKERRIHEIKRAGEKPLIKIVAADLTKEQALLVEKALIWRTGKWLTNLSGGHFADKFRPENTLHQLLPGFDTTHGIYAVNVTLYEHRHWEDSRKYAFVAAGKDRKYSSQLDRLSEGDIVAAYLPGNGYVGIGRVTEKAVPVAKFFKGRRPPRHTLAGPKLFHDAADEELCEYLVRVKWVKTVSAEEAKFRRNAGLFASRLIVASLAGQPKTREFLQERFKVRFDKLLAAD